MDKLLVFDRDESVMQPQKYLWSLAQFGIFAHVPWVYAFSPFITPAQGMAGISSFRRESLMASSVWLFVRTIGVRDSNAMQQTSQEFSFDAYHGTVCDSFVCSGILRYRTDYRLPAFVPYIPWFVIHYRIENTRILFRNVRYSGHWAQNIAFKSHTSSFAAIYSKRKLKRLYELRLIIIRNEFLTSRSETKKKLSD